VSRNQDFARFWCFYVSGFRKIMFLSQGFGILWRIFRFQGFEFLGIRGFRALRILGIKFSEIRSFEVSRILGFWFSWFQGFRNSTFKELDAEI
jgi:hypothetical protein